MRKAELLAIISLVPSKIYGKIDNTSIEAGKMTKHICGDKKFEVMRSKRSYIVDLGRQAYDCGAWQISCFPYGHSIKAFELDKREYAFDLLDKKFKTESYKQTYSRLIKLGLDPEHWEDMDEEPLLPLIVENQKGRFSRKYKEERSHYMHKIEFFHIRKSYHNDSATAKGENGIIISLWCFMYGFALSIMITL